MQPSRAGKGENGRRGLNVVAVANGLGVALAAAVALALVTGTAVALTPWEASPAVLRTLSYLAVAAGSLAAGRRAKGLGWLHGGLAGLGYLLVVAVALQPDFGLATWASVLWWGRLALAFVVGAVGGAVGLAL